MMKKILAIATAAAVVSGLVGFDFAQAACPCKQASPTPACPCKVEQPNNQCCPAEKKKCPIKAHKKHKAHKKSHKHMTGAACPVFKRQLRPVTCTPYTKLCPSCSPACPIQRQNCNCR